MFYRIAVYGMKKRIDDEEVLKQIETCGAFNRKKLIQFLKTDQTFYLNNLEKGKANELHTFFQNHGIECELEPMELDTSRRDWFIQESKKWLKRRLILQNSLLRIYQNYGIEFDLTSIRQAEKKDPKSLIHIILTIGAVLVGLGIILFIASNWKRIPDPIKIVGTTALTLAALHAGYYFKFSVVNKKALAHTFFLLSLFGIGATVILLGQIYHIPADSHILVLIWGFLVLPVALWLKYPVGFFLSSGLWFLSNIHYHSTYEASLWYYPILLFGYLFTSRSSKVKDDSFIQMNLAFLMISCAMTVSANNILVSSTWSFGILILLLMKKEIIYEYLLLTSLVFLNITFMQNYEYYPNIFYLIPLGYFTWRAIKLHSNELLIANIFNFLYWLFLFYGQLEKKYNLAKGKDTDFLLIIMALGILFFGSSKVLKTKKDWQRLSRFLFNGGIVLCAFAVYVLSFRFYSDRPKFFYSSLYFGTALYFSFLGVSLGIYPMLKETKNDLRLFYEIALFILLALSIILASLLSPYYSIHVILYNLIIFFEAIIIIYYGYQNERITSYNLGISIFVILIVSRYFDTFWGLMPRSMFFVLGGIFLIGWAIFIERLRKRITIKG